MEKLSRKRAIELHREMWRALAQTGGSKFLHALNIKYTPRNACFLCEYSHQNKGECCLLKWKYGRCMTNDRSEYSMWAHAKTYYGCKKWASIIAELPEVPEKGKKK